MFDMNSVVAEAVALVEPDLRSHGVILEFNLSDGIDLPTMGDPLLVQQVVVNLCSNASEAMEEAKEPNKIIYISTEEVGNMVKVSVANPGEPLSGRIATAMFEPFFTTRENGLGIGLSLSRSIIDSHGGMLWVDPGESDGNTFCFTLPAQG